MPKPEKNEEPAKALTKKELKQKLRDKMMNKRIGRMGKNRQKSMMNKQLEKVGIDPDMFLKQMQDAKKK